jgi:ankyrin repeat protein
MPCLPKLTVAAISVLLLLQLALCDSDLQTRLLFEAVHADDEVGVRAAVAAGARINERGKEWTHGKQTPIMLASLTGKARAIKALLALKADATLGEQDGYTPLHGAAFQGRANAAAALLADSSVPNDFHNDGFAPIHRACWGSSKGHTDTVREFLKAGVHYDLPTRTSPSKRPVDISNNPATINLLKSWALSAEDSTVSDSKGESIASDL